MRLRDNLSLIGLWPLSTNPCCDPWEPLQCEAWFADSQQYISHHLNVDVIKSKIISSCAFLETCIGCKNSWGYDLLIFLSFETFKICQFTLSKKEGLAISLQTHETASSYNVHELKCYICIHSCCVKENGSTEIEVGRDIPFFTLFQVTQLKDCELNLLLSTYSN